MGVSLLTDTRLNNKIWLTKYKRIIHEFWQAVSDLRIDEVDPSVKVTSIGDKWVCNVEKRLGLPIMWSVVPESTMQYVEEEMGEVFDLSDSARVEINWDEFFKDSWYWVNLENSLA